MKGHQNAKISRLLLLAKMTLAGLLLLWLYRSGRLQLSTLTSVRMSRDLVFLVILMFVSMVLPAFRWWWLLRLQQIDERLPRIVALTWVGYFFSLILPGSASGDMARSYWIIRDTQGARARAFSTVLFDRFLGSYSLLCLGLCSLIWLIARGHVGPALTALGAGTVVLFVALTIGAGLFIFAPSRNWLVLMMPVSWQSAWTQSFDFYAQRSNQLIGCFGLSLICSTVSIACFVLAGHVLDEVVTWDVAFLVTPLVAVGNCLPITPGGVGTAEAISSEAFGSFGLSTGAEMMILIRCCGAVVSLPGGMALFLQSFRLRGLTPRVGERYVDS